MNVGALAGEVLAATVGAGLEDARLEDVWAWGRVFGSNGSLTTGVGGLVGRLEGGQIVRGWFGGHVEDGDSTGGLVGFAEIDDGQRIEDSWAMAAVSGNNMVGGLLGGAGDDLHLPPVIYRSWAAGPIYPMPLSDSGLVGGLVGESSGVYSTDSFSGIETSGQTLAGDGGIAVDSILTLTVFNLTAGVASTVWNFGGDSNFPVLRAGDSDLQKVAMAYGLTRLSVGAGDLWSVFPIGMTMTINGDNEAILALDVNGLAANPGDAGGATPNTPIPDCRFFNDRMEAVTNYNGAKVRMWMVADNAVLRAYSGGDECYARVIGSSGGGTLRVDFAVGAQRMTLDYPFRIEGSVNPPFGVSFPSGVSSFEVMENTEITISLVGLLATFTSEQPDSPDDFNVEVRNGSVFVMPNPNVSLTTIFNADEREVMLTLTAMDALSQQTITLVAILVSPPRPFDGGNSEVRVPSTAVGAEVLSAADVRISLWHLFGKSTVFSLADSVSGLFGVNSESGRVYLADDPDPGENNRVYSLVLQGRPDDNGVLGEQIGKQTIRVLLGNPLLEVIGDGSADNPYIIDDIYELQAINGFLPDDAADEITMSLGMTAAEVRALAANLFGSTESERLTANYRLGADIDATPTNDWGVLKFKPIDNFTGVLDGCVTSACDGGVYVVRGLVINRTGGINIGLFSEIIKSSSNELAVHDLGVEDANINGGRNVGIIAGRTENAGFRKVWTSGRVDGGTGDNVGGLIGSLAGGLGSTVRMSWSTADVEGGGNVGGISGNAFGGNLEVGFSDNWAAGEVIGAANAGGFSGFADNVDYFRNWSSGAVSDADGGFLGNDAGNNLRDRTNYWDLNTSGVPGSASSDVIGVALQTLIAGNFGGNPTNAWVLVAETIFRY